MFDTATATTAAAAVSYTVTADAIDRHRAAVSVNGNHVGYLRVQDHCVQSPQHRQLADGTWELTREGRFVPVLKFRHSRDASGRIVQHLTDQELIDINLNDTFDLDSYLIMASPKIINAYLRKGGIERRIYAPA